MARGGARRGARRAAAGAAVAACLAAAGCAAGRSALAGCLPPPAARCPAAWRAAARAAGGPPQGAAAEALWGTAGPLALGAAARRGAARDGPPRRRAARRAEGGPEERPPWDVGRALRTAAFYGAVPNPFDLLRRDDEEPVGLSPGDVLWPAGDAGRLVWGVQDDVIMGGASESFLEGNVWRGNIITAGGGFAGIRTQAFRPAFDASRCQGIRLRVRGGGDQRYKLIIRDSYEWNGIAWSYEFDTKSWNPLSDVTEVMAPFSEFVPTLFAQRVPDVKYNAAKLTTLQLTLSKFGYDGDLNPNFKAGEFSITLESVGVF